MSRQNYYARRVHRRRREVDSQIVVDLVKRERCLQPRLGARKMRHLLRHELEEAGVEVGRDRFFEMLRQAELLVPLRRAKYPRTTHSRHSLPIFRNLIKEGQFKQANEVWVGDLTYLRTEEGPMYLSLLTDKVSRNIVGHHCADTLESVGCQEALKMALKQLKPGQKPIHHTDRGIQYCCHDYVEVAHQNGLRMSMTEEDHCAENALAERMNGILKGEYGLDQVFKTKKQARGVVDQAIYLYGNRRPHSSIGNEFPVMVHERLSSPLDPPKAARGLGPRRGDTIAN
jgi:putative transposase